MSSLQGISDPVVCNVVTARCMMEVHTYLSDVQAIPTKLPTMSQNASANFVGILTLGTKVYKITLLPPQILKEKIQKLKQTRDEIIKNSMTQNWMILAFFIAVFFTIGMLGFFLSGSIGLGFLCLAGAVISLAISISKHRAFKATQAKTNYAAPKLFELIAENHVVSLQNAVFCALAKQSYHPNKQVSITNQIAQIYLSNGDTEACEKETANQMHNILDKASKISKTDSNFINFDNLNLKSLASKVYEAQRLTYLSAQFSVMNGYKK